MTTRLFPDGVTAREAARTLEQEGIERVRFGVFDLDAVLREKSVSRAKAADLLRDGTSYSNVLYKWDTGERTYSGGTFEDESVVLDPASGRRHPISPDTAIFIADFTGPHRDLSPRNLATAQIERARALGFGVRAAFEYEFTVFDETPQSLRDKGYRDFRHVAVGNQAYSALTTTIDDAFISGLAETMARAEIGLDSFHTEFGPGCFEAPLQSADGLRAADDAALFKTFAKAYAQEHGRMVTFMAKWSNEWPGQSGHLHLSLTDVASGRPAFAAEDGRPNEPMLRFIAGLTRHLPDALALPAHTVNAYRRLVPGSWAPTHSSWGIENRSCAVRAIPRAGPASRIEFRVPAADSNPYLVLAACLGCGLSGIEESLEAPAPTPGDAYAAPVAPEARFPRNLLEAAERFRDCAAMQRIFGPRFVAWFAGTRDWEHRVFQRHVSDLDVRRYFEVI